MIYNNLGKPTSLTVVNGQLTTNRLKAPTSFSSSAPYFSDTGNIAVVGGQFYYYNGSAWVNPTGSVDSATYVTLTRLKDSMLSIRLALSDTAHAIRLAIPDTTYLHNNYLYAPNNALSHDLNSNGYRFIDANDPTADDQLVNRGYVNTIASGLRPTDIAKVATASALSGSYTYDAGYPYTITFDNLGTCPLIDGYQAVFNDLVLIKDETGIDSIVNGLYRLKVVGDGSHFCTFARDSNTNTSFLLQHALVPVSADYGTVNKGGAWVQSHPAIELNVTGITFTQFPFVVYAWGYGLINVGSMVYVDTIKIPTQYRVDTGVKNTRNWALSTFLTGYTETDPLSFHKADSNTLKNPVTLTYANSHFVSSETDPLSFHKVDSNTHGNAVTLDYYNNHLPAAIDTTSLSIRIDARVKYTDTVGMSNRIDLRVKYTDTVGMSNRIDARVKYTDTVGMSNRINLKVSYTDTVGTSNRINLKQNFTDTTTWDATKAYVNNALSGGGYITTGVLIRIDTYYTAATYTVTPPGGAKSMEIEAVAGGGGAAACWITTGTSTLTITGGGSAGGYFKAYQTGFVWSSATLTIGAAGSAGVISGCPTCTGTAGGNGGNTVFTDGTNTYTAFGGIGSPTVAPSSTIREAAPGVATPISTGANILNLKGASGISGFQNNTAGYRGGQGGIPAGSFGTGSDPVLTANTIGNNGEGHGSGGSGCVSNAATGAANSKNGGAGAPGGAIIRWLK